MTQLFNQNKSIFTLFEQLDPDALVHKANYVINLCDENVFKKARNHSDLTLTSYRGKPIHLSYKLLMNVLSCWVMFSSMDFACDFKESRVILNNKYYNDRNRS